MKNFAAIHVGKRWATEHTWGVMVQGENDSADLLCVGCTEAGAKQMAAQLNEPPRKGGRMKKCVPGLALVAVLTLNGCVLGPLKGGRATTAGVIGQTVVQGDNPAQASRLGTNKPQKLPDIS